MDNIRNNNEIETLTRYMIFFARCSRVMGFLALCRIITLCKNNLIPALEESFRGTDLWMIKIFILFFNLSMICTFFNFFNYNLIIFKYMFYVLFIYIIILCARLVNIIDNYL